LAYKQLDRRADAELTWKKLLTVNRDPKYVELLRQEGFTVASELKGKQKSKRFRL